MESPRSEALEEVRPRARVADARALTRHWSLLAVVVLVCALFAVRGVGKALRPRGSDFTVYYDAAERALAREDPSTVEGFIYLPSFAVLVAPLTLFPYSIAAVLWTSASFVLLLFCTWRGFQLVAGDLGRAPPFLLWLPLASLLRLVDSNLANGQVNAFTLAMMLVAFTHLRAGRDAAAGAWAGLAAATKVVPAFLLVYFALRGRFRAVAVGALTSAVLVLVVPTAVLGPDTNLEGLVTWWETTARPYLVGGEVLLELQGRVPSQSLAATCYRLLCDVPATAAGVAGPTANLLDLPPDRVRWIVRGIGALHLALCCGVVLVRRRRGAPVDLTELGLVLATALLLTPLVHKAHMLWLLVGVTALFARFTELRPAARVSFCLGLAAIALTSPALAGRGLATQLLTYNALFLGLELVWAALLLELLAAQPPEPRSA